MPGDAGGGEPGFGDMAGGADLLSMVDTLPTFDETYGAEGNAEGGAQEAAHRMATRAGAGGNNGPAVRGRTAALQTAATRPGLAPAPVVAWSQMWGPAGP